ncbi:MAG: ACT domain-containing protein [Coriobacteriia bacterium]|nr:ACT domain-containing protein [Coriobacteriia bacterium]
MANASIARQVVCSMPTKVGLMADIAEALGGAGVNVSGVCAYEDEGKGVFMLVTDDNAKTAGVLRSMGGTVEEQGVVAIDMPNTPGALASAARAIAGAGINVLMAYGSTGSSPSAIVYLSTADNVAAAAAIG